MHATQKAAGVVTSTARGTVALDLSALRLEAEGARQALALAELDQANAEASARRNQCGAVVWCLTQSRRHIEEASTRATAIVRRLEAFGQLGG